VNLRSGLPRRKIKAQRRKASRLAAPGNFAPPQSYSNPAVTIMSLRLTTWGSCQCRLLVRHSPETRHTGYGRRLIEIE
jgi:hypothetical protein